MGKIVYLFFLIQLPLTAQVHIVSKTNFRQAIDSNKVYKGQATGFRILLAYEPEKKTVDSLKLKFLSSFQKLSAYVSYEAPNFKLMVGDFRAEIEALWFSRRLPVEYPANIVQKCMIPPPRID
jgi:hypothetical protein